RCERIARIDLFDEEMVLTGGYRTNVSQFDRLNEFCAPAVQADVADRGTDIQVPPDGAYPCFAVTVDTEYPAPALSLAADKRLWTPCLAERVFEVVILQGYIRGYLKDGFDYIDTFRSAANQLCEVDCTNKFSRLIQDSLANLFMLVFVGWWCVNKVFQEGKQLFPGLRADNAISSQLIAALELFRSGGRFGTKNTISDQLGFARNGSIQRLLNLYHIITSRAILDQSC
ncbi:MAG: hypothetical protein JAY67_11925, partial [Candidatus Thiodiazotropha taylori]|nr:hypothetical protein [Candidatus Thiodiazotropha taylori]